MSPLVTVFIFFALLISLIALSKNISGFRGGEAIGGHTAGPSNIGEDFRGGGGEAIGGHTAGPSNIGEEEGFADMASANTIWGDLPSPMKSHDFVPGIGAQEDGPANASLNRPRQPYHLLQDVLPNAPSGNVSCLKASCCAETDFEERTNLTGNYLQRTNNYKRAFPDNCSTPLHEFVLSFYKNKPLNAA
jgi:hypothetical protein